MSTDIEKVALVYGRDLEVGQVFGLSEYTLTREDLLDFANKWDPQGFHIDEKIAESGAYGGLIASGIQTLAIMQRLSVIDVYDNWAVIAGKTLRDTSFLRPVRPGDVLTGTLTITGLDFDDRNRTLVDVDSEMTVEGRPVLRAAMSSLMWAAPPAATTAG
ncbi:MaoC/PaaZ C-terminal domain-containing protein [Gordonia phthalatica]|uniref:Dehydratase n=1 Tax=Gordonia phthalatica TaxID=1136941 RepID=A0A0N9N628_9ACTN|nr:MaoC/PaaZ C-terminal domain-containing protein [Gordonia phthalatica]ALG85994.1 dehydratase [Gordonia phthalatica]